ncbi:MAG: hypothetical protein CME06_15145 [Gemmatimonadetes bacterium]|nr:hypothetical protein [Gemmatimonadota bacterium]
MAVKKHFFALLAAILGATSASWDDTATALFRFAGPDPDDRAAVVPRLLFAEELDAQAGISIWSEQRITTLLGRDPICADATCATELGSAIGASEAALFGSAQE